MRKSKVTTLILVLFFLAGLSLLLYPAFSNYWNTFTQSRAVASYTEMVSGMDSDDCHRMWELARAYNSTLTQETSAYCLSDSQRETYESLLNIAGNGIMGYVEVPAIGICLPIYHGTEEGVLQIAAGHLEWTSLPVGGESSHCVISGHRGLPSARLFTDLDRLTEGDTFLLRVLEETLTYRVDQILVVEPWDTSALKIEPGQDYCTLVTCTPYGVNSHRLLVRGHRIETVQQEKEIRVTADALLIKPLFIAPIMAVPLLLVLLLILMLPHKPNHNGDDVYEP